jgi:hypothetical protein
MAENKRDIQEMIFTSTRGMESVVTSFKNAPRTYCDDCVFATTLEDGRGPCPNSDAAQSRIAYLIDQLASALEAGRE